MKELITELVEAVRAHEMRGSRPPEERADIERRYREARSELACHIRKLEQALETESALRPRWAQGYTDDSIAAQTATNAMHDLWEALGVENQTQAIQAIKQLKEG